MSYFSRASNSFQLSFFVFLVVFAGISYAYIMRDQAHDREQIKIHASIVADDVWAVNPAGAQSYLQLAIQADSYKSLTLKQLGGEPFVHVESPPLAGIERLLLRLKLIRTRILTTDVFYNNQKIGIFEGVKYVRVIYPLANILIFLLLVMLTTNFFIYLFSNRKYLERQIGERTLNLQKSERRFHDLVNLLPEMVWETDRQGNVTYANQLAFQRLGLFSSPDAPASWFDYIVPEQRPLAESYFTESIRGNDLGLREFRAVGKDAAPFPILLRSVPIAQDASIAGTRSIAIDISERYALEEQLRRAQKMKAIGLMAGGVAHDLNNILSGVVNYPELLLLDLPLDSPLRRPLEAIRKSGMQAAEVVADLLTVARGVAATKIISNPHALIDEYLKSPEYLQLTSVYPGITCSTELEKEIRYIYCSPIHVKKCLMNLITNAAEAMKGIGTITVSTSNRYFDKQPHGFDRPLHGDYCVIAVRDTGSGISPQDLKHIFEPFYTKKTMGRSGTGLGLAVVWNTMKDHEGTVIATNNKNGSTFELFFPSTRERNIKLPETIDLSAFRGNSETILIIDDDVQQQDIASRILTTLGYSVSAVSSGEEALECLKNTAIDLLILDMIMSPGMNGRETYEKILTIHPRQKAIIASGFSQSVDVKEVLKLGARSFISKPYTMEQLGEIVYKELHA